MILRCYHDATMMILVWTESVSDVFKNRESLPPRLGRGHQSSRGRLPDSRTSEAMSGVPQEPTAVLVPWDSEGITSAAAATCCPTAVQHFEYGGAEDQKTQKISVSDSSAIGLVPTLFHRYRSQGGGGRGGGGAKLLIIRRSLLASA